MTYASLLTDAEKEAFRKGDKYYVSPFKNMKLRCELIDIATCRKQVFTTSSMTRIFAAKQDYIKSQQWN